MIPLEELEPGPILSGLIAIVFIAGLCACGYGLFKFGQWVAQHYICA